MKKEYIIKPFRKNEAIKDSKREKIEDRLGKKFTDFEWQEYQRMTINRIK